MCLSFSGDIWTAAFLLTVILSHFAQGIQCFCLICPLHGRSLSRKEMETRSSGNTWDVWGCTSSRLLPWHYPWQGFRHRDSSGNWKSLSDDMLLGLCRAQVQCEIWSSVISPIMETYIVGKSWSYISVLRLKWIAKEMNPWQPILCVTSISTKSSVCKWSGCCSRWEWASSSACSKGWKVCLAPVERRVSTIHLIPVSLSVTSSISWHYDTEKLYHLSNDPLPIHKISRYISRRVILHLMHSTEAQNAEECSVVECWRNPRDFLGEVSAPHFSPGALLLESNTSSAAGSGFPSPIGMLPLPPQSLSCFSQLCSMTGGLPAYSQLSSCRKKGRVWQAKG